MFSWDPHKNQANELKHGISFEDAMRVFEDPFHVTSLSNIKHQEARWQTVGMINVKDDIANSVSVHLLVVHTGGANLSENIRIISARRIDPAERRQFESLPVDQSREVLGHSALPNGRGWFGAKGYRSRKLRARDQD